MKYILIVFFLSMICVQAQTLTPDGMTSVTTEVDFSAQEISEKIKTFAVDYLANEGTRITAEKPGKSLTLEGAADNKACVINQMMGSKTCFKLLYTIEIESMDQAYRMHVTSLKATSERYPDADYMQWFDAEGNPAAGLQSLIDGTNGYFQSINKDFKQFIEEGEYW